MSLTLGVNFVKSALGTKRNVCELLQILQVWYIKILTSWSGNNSKLFQVFQFPKWQCFLFSNILAFGWIFVSFAFNSTSLPMSMHNPVSTKTFSYSFVCLVCTLPFLKHLFWIGTAPNFLYSLSVRTMAVVSQHIISRELCSMLHTTSANWFCWKNDLAKTSSFFMWTQSDSLWGHTRSCAGTASKWRATLWEQSREGPGASGAPYTMSWASPANSFLFIQEPCCVLSPIRSICSLHCLPPRSLHFSFITLSTFSGFLPRINPLLWNSGCRPHANFCRFTLFK